MSEARPIVVRMDPRTGYVPGLPDEQRELTYLRAGADPERIFHDGQDVTGQPEVWTPYERDRRIEFEERVERYRAEGRL